jgi:antitoxin component of RelBE/YafQ-DinJ toxin-antitoxin module
MSDLRFHVQSCIEHERLAFELLELTTRQQHLSRFRELSKEEQADWNVREQAALSRLADHELEHSCGVENFLRR